ncbi:OmpA family protein [Cryomorpha ignava]|uniref:OmpA family protein n=2 Tax=Cryomorpha ignava TaxID=101383 RepID=A0A7K3WM49_9FLAO|nr:OmpA family protein [Cryomorpha ignava]
MIAAGAAGTALGATAASGNNQKPDTVYYESNAAQLKLDSLEQELTELKKQYGITDTIPAQTDTNYTPDPPIGMYFNADSTGTDSVGAASGDGTVLNSDSLRMQKDLLGLSDSLSADSLSRAEFADGILEPSVRSDEDEIRANSTIIEDKSSAQQDVEANPIVLIGNYPVVCNFGLNKTLLDAGELKKLDPVVADLKNDKTLKVFLTGYTDNSGNADYNLKLSKERAKSVMDYLIAEGVAADRIEVSGSGVLESADKFSSNARRVDVSISD